MATWFKKSFRPSPEELPEALRELLDDVRQQKGELEALLAKVSGAERSMANQASRLEDFHGRQEAISVQITDVERRADALSVLSGRVGILDQRTETLEEAESRSRSRIEELRQEMDRLEASASAIREVQSRVGDLRSEVDRMGGESGLVPELDSRTEELDRRLRGLAEEVEQATSRQGMVRESHDDVLARFTDAQALARRLTDEVEESSGRLQKLQGTLTKLSKVQEVTSRTEQQLESLNALADHVSQKTAQLGNQREVVDRAAAQAARLDDLVWELDSKLAKVQEDGKRIQKAQKTIEDLQEFSGRTESRLGELLSAEKEAVQTADTLEARLNELRRQIQEGLNRLEMERGGLDSANEQTAAIRRSLVDVERRQDELERSSRSLAEARARADDLAARLTSLASDVGRVEEHGERIRALRQNLDQSTETLRLVGRRIEELQASQPALEELATRVEALQGVGDRVADERDRLVQAREELERSQEARTELRRWLAETDRRAQEQRAHGADLDARGAEIERIRASLDGVFSIQKALEEREPFVRELEVRVDELRALRRDLDARAEALEQQRVGIQAIEARTAGLSGRLDDADRKFESVARRSDEVARVESRLGSVTEKVEGVAGRVEALEISVEEARSRALEMEALEERMQAMGRQLTEREAALASAFAGLEKASRLREQVSEGIRDVERESHNVARSIEMATEQAAAMAELADQVEARVGNLRFTEKRMAQFEDKLVSLGQAERNLEESKQRLTERQEGVDAVRDELAGLFERTERTLSDVRAIGEARFLVETTRSTLNDVLDRAKHVDQLAHAVDRRRSEIEDAERRMGRMEALLTDLRSGLQMLRSEKAIVDVAIEKTGALSFQVKEAEALIRALKEERKVTTLLLEAEREEEKRAG